MARLDNFFSKMANLLPAQWRWIFDHAGFRRYLANTSWLLGGQFLYLFVSFIVGVWIARYLGPEKYGSVNYVIAFVGLFSFLYSLGIDGVLNRELVKAPEKKEKFLGTGWRMRLIGAALAYLAVLIFSFPFSQGDQRIQALILMYALSFFFQPALIFNNFFYSQVRAKESMKAQVAAALVSAILKIALILLKGGVTGLLIIYALDTFWQGLFLWYSYRNKEGKTSAWHFDSKLAKELWRDSWPLMLSTAASFIYLKIDQVMIGWMLGEASVGIYAAGVKLVEVFYFLPSIICSSLFPAIVTASRLGPETFRRRLKHFYILLALSGLLVAAVISVFATPAIRLIFGAPYLAAVPVLKIYIWSSIGLFLATGINQQLTAENRTRTVFFLNLTAMAMNIGLNLVLIPALGLSGAALATLISYSAIPIIIALARKRSDSARQAR